MRRKTQVYWSCFSARIDDHRRPHWTFLNVIYGSGYSVVRAPPIHRASNCIGFAGSDWDQGVVLAWFLAEPRIKWTPLESASHLISAWSTIVHVWSWSILLKTKHGTKRIHGKSEHPFWELYKLTAWDCGSRSLKMAMAMLLLLQFSMYIRSKRNLFLALYEWDGEKKNSGSSCEQKFGGST